MSPLFVYPELIIYESAQKNTPFITPLKIKCDLFILDLFMQSVKLPPDQKLVLNQYSFACNPFIGLYDKKVHSGFISRNIDVCIFLPDTFFQNFLTLQVI